MIVSRRLTSHIPPGSVSVDSSFGGVRGVVYVAIDRREVKTALTLVVFCCNKTGDD
jgi:hypothetical protein